MKKLFTIKDTVAGVYNDPFTAINENEAQRQCFDAVNDTRTVLNKHPEDFALYCLGSYDERSGEIKYDISFVVNVVDLVSKKEE